MQSLYHKQKLLQAKIAMMIKPQTGKVAEETITNREEQKDDQEATASTDTTTNNSDIKPSSYGLRPKHSFVNINADKWLLTLDDEARQKLDNPPSGCDSIDRNTEEELRYLGCELIQTGAILLRLPQTAAATGQIIYQRFYYQKSFATYYFEHAVMACLLLASKIEEAPRRPRDIINVFSRMEQLHRLRRAGRPIIRGSKYLQRGCGRGSAGSAYSENTGRLPVRVLDAKYSQTKALVIKTERRMLTALGFVVHVKHPHKLMISYIHTLQIGDRTDIVQRAWSYMNDGLRTDLFLRYEPETIACACIFLAARTVEEPLALPNSPFNWFELFDASDRDVEAIALTLLRMYSRKSVANWKALNEVVAYAHDLKNPPREDEKAKAAAEVARRLVEDNKKKNGDNDSNGRHASSRSRSRSKSKRKGYSPDGRRKDRKEERKDRRDKSKDRHREKRDRDRKRSRDRERERERGGERPLPPPPKKDRRREKEPYGVLVKRNHRDISPPSKFRK